MFVCDPFDFWKILHFFVMLANDFQKLLPVCRVVIQMIGFMQNIEELCHFFFFFRFFEFDFEFLKKGQIFVHF